MAVSCRIKSSFLGHVFKLAVPEIVVKRHPALRSRYPEEKISILPSLS